VGALIGGTGGVVIGRDLLDSSGSSSTSSASGSNNTQLASDKLSSATISSIASHVLPSVVEVTETTSSGKGIGSGVILTSTGEILTNYHVISDVANGGTLTVTFSNGKTASATVVGTNSSSDLAVIKAKRRQWADPATLGDSSKVKVGDGVVAIGAPEGLQTRSRRAL